MLGIGRHKCFNNNNASNNKLLQFFAARKYGSPYHFISNVTKFSLGNMFCLVIRKRIVIITVGLFTVQNVIGQEIGGPMFRKFIVTPSFYNHLQLQRQTLGHLSAVYCLLFDHTGKYIVTV